MTNGNGAPLENAAPPQFNVLAQYIVERYRERYE